MGSRWGRDEECIGVRGWVFLAVRLEKLERRLLGFEMLMILKWTLPWKRTAHFNTQLTYRRCLHHSCSRSVSKLFGLIRDLASHPERVSCCEIHRIGEAMRMIALSRTGAHHANDDNSRPSEQRMVCREAHWGLYQMWVPCHNVVD